ncbi:hypothetical protein G8A07_01915 [Roseateles sp. DAIF2]|uniref:hypothetical protein n=1 Tax=Roseateles sp. DAIF2 TaxID=2714952 RepID=UPI0018A2B55F|nr:hypothetical protein [Roseateles sp. DAIF2]QPF71807.1 hypothetical protein G8A07_01915 [Roseateles sp. DAIF2]
MRASEIYRYPVQTSSFGTDPLRERRRVVQEEFAAGATPPVRLDTTSFTSSPLQDFIDEAQHDVYYGLKPLGQLAESVKAVHTPAYSRGQYTLYEGDGLRVRVELGPLMWQHTERGGTIGGLVDTFA